MVRPLILLASDVHSACQGDVERLAALDAACFPAGRRWDAARYKSQLASAAGVLIVTLGTELIACAAYHGPRRRQPYGYLVRICVQEAYRNRTIGKQLLAQVQARIQVLHAVVPESDLEVSAVFLQRCGFKYLETCAASAGTVYEMTTSAAEAEAARHRRAALKARRAARASAVPASLKSRMTGRPGPPQE